MNTPFDQAQQRTDGPREALKIGIGLGAGLIPAACAFFFVTTLCPSGATVACQVPTDGIHVALFVGACCFYLLQVVATVFCFIWRATRPVALGLLVMLFLGPLIAAVSITYVFETRAPRAGAAGPLLLLPVLPRGRCETSLGAHRIERQPAHTYLRVRAVVVVEDGSRPRRLPHRARRSLASRIAAESAVTISEAVSYQECLGTASRGVWCDVGWELAPTRCHRTVGRGYTCRLTT